MSKVRSIEKPEKKYKVLDGLNPPIQDTGFEYEIGRDYNCDDFCNAPEKDCAAGFYATELDGLPYAWNTYRNIYEVEVWGRAVEINEFKRRYENIRILRELDPADVAEEANEIEDELGYRLSEVIQPVNPAKITPPEITDEHIELLREWYSVGDSVWDPVRDPVWDLVRDSVRDSVWDPVWDSVWDSVWRSVWDPLWGSVRDSVRDSVCSAGNSVRYLVYAYIGSLFPEIDDWKYIDHEPGEYPLQSAVDLWKQGLVPSYDGKTWRLHGGENMDILYEEAD